MLHLLCPLVVCGECPESGSSGLGVATSTRRGNGDGHGEGGKFHAYVEEADEDGTEELFLNTNGESFEPFERSPSSVYSPQAVNATGETVGRAAATEADMAESELEWTSRVTSPVSVSELEEGDEHEHEHAETQPVSP